MKKTILLLVSDSAIRSAISKSLQSEGYFVMEADAIDRAVKWVKEYSPDMLIARHYTQNISGHDAAVYLRRLCPGMPVLLVGGLLDDPGLENREALQGFEIFPKPYKAAELLARVNEVLARSAIRSKADVSSHTR